MKKNNNRIARLESDILRILSEQIVFGLKDPRISPLVSVTRVELTRDMSYATVYVTGAEEKTLLEGLQSAKGFLRKTLADELEVFRIPELLFVYDRTTEYLHRIDSLIEQVSRKGVTTHTLEEIGNTIRSDSYRKIAVMPHIFADGDAVGSCVAMCRVLTSLGKQAYLTVAEEIAGNLRFLLDGVTLTDGEGEDFDLLISLDTGSLEQIRDRKEVFRRASKTISIDHHKTNEGFADMVYVDVNASATAEILYDLFRTMEIKVTPEIGAALFTAISTDTGSFKHSNTTAKTFEVAAELLKTGFPFSFVTNNIYKNVPLRKATMLQETLKCLDIVDGCYAISHTLEGPESKDPGDYEGITDYLLSFEGIEVAMFARRLSATEIKFSLRSKNQIDVSKIAESMGGGGHMKASGFVTSLDFTSAKNKVIEVLRNFDKASR